MSGATAKAIPEIMVICRLLKHITAHHDPRIRVGLAEEIENRVKDGMVLVEQYAEILRDGTASRNARHMVSLLRVGPCKFGWRKAS